MKIIYKFNNIEKLKEVIKISIDIFNPNEKEIIKYHDIQDWKQRLKDGLLVTAQVANDIVGFGICFPRKNSFHIWNAGVLEEYRNQGIWKGMLEKIMEFAKGEHYKYVTINTYKEKFPNMYSFLIKNNFSEYQENSELKSFFRKRVL